MSRRHWLGLCAWCLLAVVVEIGLYLSYHDHDAGFHRFAHFYAGASAALLLMSLVAWRQRRPVRFPLLWIVAAHVYAMFPDLLFVAGIPHQPWMVVFLGHITIHYIPGANLTLFAIFMASFAVCLGVISRGAGAGADATMPT